MVSCFSYEVQPIHYQGSCCERLFQFPKEPINNQFIWEHEVCLGLGVLFFMFNNTNRKVLQKVVMDLQVLDLAFG